MSMHGAYSSVLALHPARWRQPLLVGKLEMKCTGKYNFLPWLIAGGSLHTMFTTLWSIQLIATLTFRQVLPFLYNLSYITVPCTHRKSSIVHLIFILQTRAQALIHDLGDMKILFSSS